MVRVFIGFLLCVFALPCVAFALGDTKSAVLVGVFTLVASLLGLALLAMFKAIGWVRVWHIVPAATVLGVLVAWPAGGAYWAGARGFIAPFAMFGAVHGLVFWFVAICGNRALMQVNGDLEHAT
jgi:hypothetical protein